MAKYTGPACRLCRREGTKLFLKGERCLTGKCAIERRRNAPGQHGASNKMMREYGIQLREKQKARRYYGVLEGQFRSYFEMAEKQAGVTGENMLSLLERRLDNVVYRMGLAASRREARQMLRNDYFTLNGKKANIPSILVREGDVVTLKDDSKKLVRVKQLLDSMGDQTTPKWLSVDVANASATVVALPKREDVDFPFEEQLIVELYSK